MKRITSTSLLILLTLTAMALADQQGTPRTFTGTWTCLACGLKGVDGAQTAECEQLGHKRCLRLSSGNYIFFLENERSTDLLKGGRLHNVRLTVKGTYYPKAHSIDVQSYIIDGKTTSWCAQHQRMDMDNDPVTKQASEETGK